MTFMLSYEGYLTILVEKAAHLLPRDLNGQSDPYTFFEFVADPDLRLPNSGCTYVLMLKLLGIYISEGRDQF